MPSRMAPNCAGKSSARIQLFAQAQAATEFSSSGSSSVSTCASSPSTRANRLSSPARWWSLSCLPIMSDQKNRLEDAWATISSTRTAPSDHSEATGSPINKRRLEKASDSQMSRPAPNRRATTFNSSSRWNRSPCSRTNGESPRARE